MINDETLYTENSVGVGEIFVSSNALNVITAHGLGSCVGVVAYDVVAKVGGIAHIQLPSINTLGERVRKTNFQAADRAIPELFDQLTSNGADLTNLYVLLVGGAQVVHRNDFFKIGEKNQQSCLQQLKSRNISIGTKRLGGKYWRTVKLYLDLGKIEIKSGAGETEIIEISNQQTHTCIRPDSESPPEELKTMNDLEMLLAPLVNEQSPQKNRNKKYRVNNVDDIKKLLAHLVIDENGSNS